MYDIKLQMNIFFHFQSNVLFEKCRWRRVFMADKMKTNVEVATSLHLKMSDMLYQRHNIGNIRNPIYFEYCYKE